MTKSMRSTDAYASLHSKLVSEVRSEPLGDGVDLTAGRYVFDLLSASSAICALPRAMFAADDVQDIRNVIRNLSKLVEGR